jgi:hypothetical protein
MNLTGHWKGKFTYGKGYPLSLVGKSKRFEFDMIDNEGIITGTCIDEIVTSIPGNESNFEGIFNNNYISFVKRYKYNSILDNSNGKISVHDVNFDGIQYTGRLFKRIFSKKVYFRGEWTITSAFRDKTNNKISFFTIKGAWTMERT